MKPRPIFLLSLALAAALSNSKVTAQSAPVDPTDDILLDVYISPPAAMSQDFGVTITATANGSLVSDSSHNFEDGFDLANFFTSDQGFGNYGTGLNSNLTTYIDQTPIYDSFLIDDFSTQSSTQAGVDLNLYSAEDPDGTIPETFTAGTQAFVGYVSFVLHPGIFQGNGDIGNIYAGYSNDDAPPEGTDAIGIDDPVLDGLPLLGQYEVFFVPEPRQSSMLLVGALGLAAFWRFRPSRGSRSRSSS